MASLFKRRAGFLQGRHASASNGCKAMSPSPGFSFVLFKLLHRRITPNQAAKVSFTLVLTERFAALPVAQCATRLDWLTTLTPNYSL
jgi:hypothetical protein